ncbi:gamma-mobile-trio protein GmtX [Stutzerimonas kunmingensis]|uniref:gamma-mobile-trio protein GmtX n=1 Tax=Stutzerimonas kunmingensis TaxID=1211807 RepID=UPI0028A926A9|nr:gamma-mobile-trio protein GmtX [Stutzerimonas kunmingensis]
MSEQLVSPQDTYRRLMSEASDSRRKRSLEAINEACRLLHERHSSDFSYKTIITLGKDRGLLVPGEKSIVNKTGEHYRELIQAWKLLSLPKASKTITDPNDWIEHIPDPVLRMSVSLLAKELRALKAKESRKAAHSGAPIILGSLVGQAVSTRPFLNDAELAALKAAIDPASLGLVGLSIGSRGELVDAKGRTIHKPGFRDAIEKVLAVQLK